MGMASSRYLLRFSYLGTRYRGMQRQSSRPCTEHWTVQGAIEAALGQLRPLNSEPVLVLASRTDTGVHAVESAAHVDFRPANPLLQFQPEHLATSLNHILGRHKHDILIRDVLQVPDWFHARYLARWRSYRYRLAVLKSTAFGEQRMSSLRRWLPLSELNRCHIVPPLDVDRAHEAMELLSGQHDFRSFKNVGRTPEEDERDTVREVTDFRLRPATPVDSDDPLYENFDLWEFHITSKSFLYRQVRRMVSMVLHVALSQPGDANPLELVRHLLENPSKDSWPGGVRVAPACGLYLTHVHYDAAHLDVTAEMPEEVAEMYRARDDKRFEELDSSNDDDDDEEEEAASQGAAASACT